MPITHIETVSIGTAAVTSTAVTFTLAITAGDFLVSGIRADTSGTVTVSDNINGTWTKAWGPVTNNAQYYFANSTAAGANGLALKVTDTVSGGIRIIGSHFRGVATITPLDQTSTKEIAGNANWNAGTTTSTPGGELVYASWGLDGGVTVSFTAGLTNGVAMVIPVNGTVGTSALGLSGVEYALASVAGIQNSTATASAAVGWHGGQGTYSAPAVSAVGPVLLPLLMVGGRTE